MQTDLCVSLEMDHSSVSLTFTFHLSCSQIKEFQYGDAQIYILCRFKCNDCWKDEGEEEEKTKEKEKENVEVRERNRRAATMYHALHRRFVIFYFQFCSFPHSSFFSLLLSSFLFASSLSLFPSASPSFSLCLSRCRSCSPSSSSPSLSLSRSLFLLSGVR